MTQQKSALHIDTPIHDVEEIPYDRSEMGPGSFIYEIEFNREEMDRLKTRSTRRTEPLGRWIKRVVFEAIEREAAAKSADVAAD